MDASSVASRSASKKTARAATISPHPARKTSVRSEGPAFLIVVKRAPLLDGLTAGLKGTALQFSQRSKAARFKMKSTRLINVGVPSGKVTGNPWQIQSKVSFGPRFCPDNQTALSWQQRRLSLVDFSTGQDSLTPALPAARMRASAMSLGVAATSMPHSLKTAILAAAVSSAPPMTAPA